MALRNRYDFMFLFDVENGNPNGDPDAANEPRMDAESGHGYVTDVCLKRKIRNYVELVKEGVPGYNILIRPDRTLNAKFKEAYEAQGLETGNKKKAPDDVKQAQEYLCRNYFDVRTFGAVMSTGDDPCGIVRGPVQINFARSISPIAIEDVTITRQARTTADRAETGNTEMGRKSVIPYALYRAEGYVSAALANKTTDLSDEDLDLLWEAIINMFEHDHSAARGKMCVRKLFIFKHDSIFGNVPSHILFDKIHIVQNRPDVPRAFTDYTVEVDRDIPATVELIEK